jgi:hypothetical protein
MDALNRHLRSETEVKCARVNVVERGKGTGVLGDLESSGFDMSGITLSSATDGGGMVVDLGMESEEQKLPIIPKRRQTGGEMVVVVRIFGLG